MQFEQNSDKIRSINGFHIPKHYSVIQTCNNNSELIVFYSEYEYKATHYTIWKSVYNKTEKTTFNPKKIASIELDPKDRVIVYSSHSEDQSKYSILFLICSNFSGLKSFRAMSIDKEGNILWDKNDELNLPSNTFYIKDCKTHNDGTIYTAIVSHNINSRGNIIENEYLNILALNENMSEITSEAITSGTIRDFGMKILKKGNIVIAGYMSTEAKSETDKVFHAYFDTQDKSFSGLNIRFINNIMNVKKKSNLGLNILHAGTFGYTVIDIVELGNGDPVMLGEMRGWGEKLNSPATFSHATNVLYHNLSEANNSVNAVIQKYQLATRLSLISFSHFVRGNDIYFVYNDHIKNFDKPHSDGDVYTYEFDRRRPKSTCTTLSKIDADGKVSKKEIHRFSKKNSPFFFYDVIHSFENETLLTFAKINKKMFQHPYNYSIFKLTDFEF
jgi:hypothetical protein